MHFRREEIESFHATDYDFDPGTGIIILRYGFEGGSPGQDHRGSGGRGGRGRGGHGRGGGAAPQGITFEEQIDLGGPLRLDASQEAAFERIVRVIHAAAGTSYYKAAAPPIVSIDSGPLTAFELRLVEDLYDKGLREFAYKNGLPVPVPVEVRARVEQTPESGRADGGTIGDKADGDPPEGLGIPVGGGKDSIVVVEALRDMRPLLVGVNPSPATRRVAEVAGLDLVSLGRKIDPSLLDLNAAGALNGHVPITAVISLIAVAAGYVHGYSATVMSLEGSSDEATRRIGETDVNHQWSKSTDCEVQLQKVLASVSGGIRYGSVLRGLSELEIGRCFAGLPGYHQVFRSCNRAFTLSGARDGWCNDCPKCRFVYLTLATSLGREEMIGIFGEDLLGAEDQTDGFLDLFDSDRKPFECVGTRTESIAAFEELFVSPVWSGSVVVKAIRSILQPVASPGLGAQGLGTQDPGVRRSGEDVLREVRRAAELLIGPRSTAGSVAGPTSAEGPGSVGGPGSGAGPASRAGPGSADGPADGPASGALPVGAPGDARSA